MVTYKATEENVQTFLEGKVIAEVLFLRDKPDSPYGTGSNMYIRTHDGFVLISESEHTELTLQREEKQC